MGEPLKSLSPRARLGAALPAHYPGTPANFEDVSDESTLSLNDVLARISTEDATLVNQIRRFRGPWLLSSSSDSNDKIVCCSNPFVSQMGYPEGELVGENCKKLQQGCLQGAGEWNGIHNKTLRESFAKVRPQRGVANTMSAYTPKDLPYALLQRRFYAANATSKTPLAQLIALFLEC